jgi:DNA-binding XRE family transcriptional regulator
MTADQYRAALATLNLTQGQAAKWLGVSLKTSHLYARNGPSGPAAKAVSMAVALRACQLWWGDDEEVGWIDPDDVAAAIGLDKIRPEAK